MLINMLISNEAGGIGFRWTCCLGVQSRTQQMGSTTDAGRLFPPVEKHIHSSSNIDSGSTLSFAIVMSLNRPTRISAGWRFAYDYLV